MARDMLGFWATWVAGSPAAMSLAAFFSWSTVRSHPAVAASPDQIVATVGSQLTRSTPTGRARNFAATDAVECALCSPVAHSGAHDKRPIECRSIILIRQPIFAVGYDVHVAW